MNQTSHGGREQRKFVRAERRLPVRLKLVGGSVVTQDLAPVDTVTRDISEGGVFIELGQTRIAPGQTILAESFLLLRASLHMEIQLPDGASPVVVEGKTVWVEKPVEGLEFHHGIAVQFTNLTPTDQARIAALVNSSL